MKVRKIVFVRVILLLVLGLCVYLFTREITNSDGRVAGLKTKNLNTKIGKFVVDAPSESSVSAPIKFDLSVDTKGQAINAVALNLRFPSNRVKVLSMETSNSFCEFFPVNKFDNDQGLIKIACGLPSPGFRGVGKVASIVFEPLSTGNVILEVMPNSAILLNDGKATNILGEFPSHEVIVLGNL